MKTCPKCLLLILSLLVILACAIPSTPENAPSSSIPATPASAQQNNNASNPTSQPPAPQPTTASQPASSTAPTLPPPAPSSNNNSSADKTPPNLNNINPSVTTAYYHDNGCGPTTVTISADATDDSGTVSSVWVDYQYLSMSTGIGGNEWFRTEFKSVGNGHFEGLIDLTQKADQELQGNEGTLQYQVYAMDAAGNTKVVPDGYVYGVEALPCFPQAAPPNAPDSITITNLQTYPQGAVYYGNCSTEETIFNLEATIEPQDRIASATIYYAYTGSNGAYGNYSSTMNLLGIGDYSGDADVGSEAAFALGTSDGTLDAYISVVDVDGNTTESGWVSIPVVYCPGSAVGDPPLPASINKGSGPIYNNNSLDLDNGNGDDILFSHTNSDGIQLLSVWGAELKIDLSADIESCKQSIDSDVTFTAVNIDVYDVVCFKTGSGNYGYLTVNGMFIDLDDPNNSYADISYETEVFP